MLGNFTVPFCSEVQYKSELESLGHTVYPLQENNARAAYIQSVAMRSDMLIWIHTHDWHTPKMENVIHNLKQANIPIVAYHLDLYMGISRWEQYKNDPYIHSLDYFFTVDKKMADYINENTSVKAYYLPAAIYSKQAHKGKFIKPFESDVCFIGARGYHKEWQYRPQLIDWLLDTYGQRFKHWGADGLGVMREERMNMAYASTKIAVGDTLCLNFDYPYYLSDRIFNATGTGTFIIHPYIKGIEYLFEIDKEIVTYEFGNFEELKEKIDYYLAHDDEREKIAQAGFERTKKEHLYTHRMQYIIDKVTA